MNISFAGNHASRATRSHAEMELADRLAGSILCRARGRIRDLHVVCSEDAIVIEGRSRTHHDKQLAHEAVLDLTGGRPLLTNQIKVC